MKSRNMSEVRTIQYINEKCINNEELVKNINIKEEQTIVDFIKISLQQKIYDKEKIIKHIYDFMSLWKPPKIRKWYILPDFLEELEYFVK